MKRAFSIVEIIVALFVVAVGMYAVIKLNPLGQRAAVVTKEHLMAQRIARNVIAQVQSMPFGSDCKKLEGPVLLREETVEGNPANQEFAVTQVRLTIPPQPAGTKIGYGTVNVTVAWRSVGGDVDPTNSTKSLTLTGGISREP